MKFQKLVVPAHSLGFMMAMVRELIANRISVINVLAVVSKLDAWVIIQASLVFSFHTNTQKILQHRESGNMMPYGILNRF